MRLLDTIIAVCWIGFWLYWIKSAFGAKKSDIHKVNFKRFFGIRLVLAPLAIILVVIIRKLPQSFKNHPLGTSGVVLALGLILVLLGLIIAVRARVSLGKNWGMPMTRKQNPELVTAGPYRYVRHPIYTGMLLMMLGSAIDVNTYWLIVFILAACFFIYSAVTEETDMTRQFPKAYPPYRRKTKMLIPFIF